MSQKSSYARYQLIRAILLLQRFRDNQKISFSQTFIFANQTNIFLSLTLSLANLEKTTNNQFNFVEIAKICETCDDFCGVER